MLRYNKSLDLHYKLYNAGYGYQIITRVKLPNQSQHSGSVYQGLHCPQVAFTSFLLSNMSYADNVATDQPVHLQSDLGSYIVR